MHAPELSDLVFFVEEHVAGVLCPSFIEWNVLCSHEEEDHTTREKVSLECLIAVVTPKFRSHVLGCSKTCCGEALFCRTTKWAGEAEVSKLDVVIVIKQAVLWFEVTMGHVVLVHIEYCIDDLIEEVLAHGLAHMVVVHNKVEEIALLDELHAEKCAWFIFLTFKFQTCVRNELMILDQSGTLKYLCGIVL